MKAQLTKGAAVLGVAAAVSLFQALPASAYSIDKDNKTITFTLGDSLPEVFTVLFDGNVSENNVAGLTSKANVQLTSFTTTSASFLFELFNTSSNGITSRVSALGFDVDPDVSSVSILPGGGFNRARTNESLPNEFGPLEVCFTSAPGNSRGSCEGGPGGATAGNPITFTGVLNFAAGAIASNSNSFTLSNFGVRYQSITGVEHLGTSGTGQGTPIPTPALLPGLIGLGVAALRKRNGATEDQEAA